MREIKFRGLTNDAEPKWVYGCLVNNLWTYSELNPKYPKGTPICEIIVVGDCDDYADMEDKELAVSIIPDSVGMFTGLKDRTGKEIYEGDIIDFDFDSVIFVGNGYDVIFQDGAFLVNKPNFKPLLSDCERIRVVGNIHQNKF